MPKEMPTFSKAPPELIAQFEGVFPGPPAEGRKMFGYPAGFVNGNLFMGLFQDKMFVRLGDADQAQLLAEEGSEVLMPMPGRTMTGYIVLPAAVRANAEALKSWVDKALSYGASLPPKVPKPKPKAKAKAKPKP